MTQTVAAVSDAVFRALTKSSPDGIVFVDQEGRIALINLQTEKLFGYTREELLGHAVEALVPKRMRGRHRGHRTGFMGHPQVQPMGRVSSCLVCAKMKRSSPSRSASAPYKRETACSFAPRSATLRIASGWTTHCVSPKPISGP
jgi:hypothetical protein